MMRAASGPASDRDANRDEASRHDLEALLIRRIARGDRAAFEELYRAYQLPLFRYFLRMVGSTAAAEELADDVLVAVWQGAGRFRAESKPSTWVFGIAHHKALNARREKLPDTMAVDAMADLPSPDEGPEELLLRERFRQRVESALTALSPEHREVLQLTFYQGLSCAEIASVVGRPVNTVKTRMFHARRRLQRVLEGMGVGAETP